MPSQYTSVGPRKAARAGREDAGPAEPLDEPRRAPGFFRGVLFAAPVALLLWALLLLAARALLHHLPHL